MKVVAYYRVSTQKQGTSKLGIEAQKEAVGRMVREMRGTVVAEFIEVESGKNDTRPKLQEALTTSRLHNATMVVAKLDRLSRNAAFLLTLQKSSVRFVCCDLPHANDLTIGIMAIVAQEEARLISIRTKNALEALKARGVKLGSPKPMTKRCMTLGQVAASDARKKHSTLWNDDAAQVVIPTLRECGSLTATAERLNELGVPTRRGRNWTATSVRRVVLRSTQHAA